jgi:hypothetical protein
VEKLDSRDTAINLAIFNYLTREFRAASRMDLLRGDIRIYASSEGFLFNDGAVEQFVILRGNAVSGIVAVEPPANPNSRATRSC